MAMLMRITMIVTTTISSTNVKPRVRRRLPFGIRCSVRRLVRRLAIDVEDALSSPGETLGVVLIAAQSPLRPPGERIHGDAAQEAHLLSIGARELDAFHQHVQRLRPVVGSRFLR